MDNLKSNLNTQKHTDTGRRSFIWKVGAGMSAILATAVPSMAKTRISNDKSLKTRVERLSKQVGLLEDENAIRRLHKVYENYLDSGKYGEVVNLFTDDAEVIFNGGVFKGKNKGVHRLYAEQFSAGLTGKKMDPAPGFQPDTEQQQDIVDISQDSRSAKAKFNYSIQVGTPMHTDSTLVRMARLQGEGIMKWWEGGTYEVSYVKDKKDSNWKIKRLEYRVLSKADYRPGRSYTRPISVPPFSKVYPEDLAGPDRLITSA